MRAVIARKRPLPPGCCSRTTSVLSLPLLRDYDVSRHHASYYQLSRTRKQLPPKLYRLLTTEESKESEPVRQKFESRFDKLWLDSTGMRYKQGDAIPDRDDRIHTEAFVACAQLCATRGDFQRLFAAFNEAKSLQRKGIMDGLCYISLAELCARFGDQDAVIYVVQLAVEDEGIRLDRGTACVLVKCFSRLDLVYELYKLMLRSASRHYDTFEDSRVYLFDMCLDGNNGMLAKELMTRSNETKTDARCWQKIQEKLTDLDQSSPDSLQQGNSWMNMWRPKKMRYESELLGETVSSELLAACYARDAMLCLAQLCCNYHNTIAAENRCGIESSLPINVEHTKTTSSASLAAVCAHCRHGALVSAGGDCDGMSIIKPAQYLYEKSDESVHRWTVFVNAFLKMLLQQHWELAKNDTRKESILAQAVNLHRENCQVRQQNNEKSVYDFIEPSTVASLAKVMIDKDCIAHAFALLNMERQARTGKWLSNLELSTLFSPEVCRTPTQYQRLIGLLQKTADIHDIIRLRNAMDSSMVVTSNMWMLQGVDTLSPAFERTKLSSRFAAEIDSYIQEFQSSIFRCLRQGPLASSLRESQTSVAELRNCISRFVSSFQAINRSPSNATCDKELHSFWVNSIQKVIVLINSLLQLHLPPVNLDAQKNRVAMEIWGIIRENTEKVVTLGQNAPYPLSFVDVNSIKLIARSASYTNYSIKGNLSVNSTDCQLNGQQGNAIKCDPALSDLETFTAKLQGGALCGASNLVKPNDGLSNLTKMNYNVYQNLASYLKMQKLRSLAETLSKEQSIYPDREVFQSLLKAFVDSLDKGENIDEGVYENVITAIANANHVHTSLFAFWSARHSGKQLSTNVYKSVLSLLSTIPCLGGEALRIYKDFRQSTFAKDFVEHQSAVPSAIFSSTITAVANDLRLHIDVSSFGHTSITKPWLLQSLTQQKAQKTSRSVHRSILDTSRRGYIFDLSLWPLFGVDIPATADLGTGEYCKVAVPTNCTDRFKLCKALDEHASIPKGGNANVVQRLHDLSNHIASFSEVAFGSDTKAPILEKQYLTSNVLSLLSDVYELQVSHTSELVYSFAKLSRSLEDPSSAQSMLNAFKGTPSLEVYENCLRTFLSTVPRRNKDNTTLYYRSQKTQAPGAMYSAISRGFVDGNEQSLEENWLGKPHSPSWVYWLKVSTAVRLRMLHNFMLPTDTSYQCVLAAAVRRGHADKIPRILHEQRVVERLKQNPNNVQALAKLESMLNS